MKEDGGMREVSECRWETERNHKLQLVKVATWRVILLTPIDLAGLALASTLVVGNPLSLPYAIPGIFYFVWR